MDGFLVGISKFDASSGFIMEILNPVLKLSQAYREAGNLFLSGQNTEVNTAMLCHRYCDTVTEKHNKKKQVVRVFLRLLTIGNRKTLKKGKC